MKRVFDKIYGEEVTWLEVVVTIAALAGWFFLIVSQ